MKILILANDQGGLYRFRKDLIERLLSDGHDVAICVPDGCYIPYFISSGCTYYQVDIDRRGINPLRDIKLVKRYRQVFREYKPDLAVTYTIKPNIYGGFISRLTRTEYAENITGLGTAFQERNLIRIVVKFLYKYALHKAKVIFFENSANRDLMVEMGICKENRTHVLAGAGVNLETYYYQDYPENNRFHFLFVGRIMKEKGIDELFLATQRLANEGNDCILDVVGYYEENYKDIIDRQEKQGWLYYHGSQEDVRPYYGQCDCFVLPSWHEGMANTNLEASSSGRPIITSNIPGCREAVENNQTGILCEPKDTDSLYTAMLTMMQKTRDERKEMGIAARKRMEACFNKADVVSQTIDHMCDGVKHETVHNKSSEI